MRIEMCAAGAIRSDAVERYAGQVFERALGRIGERVREVLVRVRDVNGPRGGTDMEARAEIVLEHRGACVVTARGEDAYGALHAAADKAKHAVFRELEKRRDHH